MPQRRSNSAVSTALRPSYRERLRQFRRDTKERTTAVRVRWAERIAPTGIAGTAPTTGTPTGTAGPHPLDAEAHAWLHAHRSGGPAGDSLPPSTVMVYVDQDFQTWMSDTLTALGHQVTEPVLLSEGWVPARGENLSTGQPAPTFTTVSKTFTHARKNDPETSKTAGANAAAKVSITVNSHQGQLLLAYHRQHVANPGVGFTAAQAVSAADLLTDGATGSPWRRVTDLRDLHLVTALLDETAHRVVRKNDSNSDGGVLVITPLGLRAAAALHTLDEHGYRDYPLSFEGPSDEALFEDLAQTIARVDPDEAQG